jgi:hypothetical protein
MPDTNENNNEDRKQYWLKKIKKGPSNFLQVVPEELRRDREIVLTAVQKHGSALQYASKELQVDREIVLAATRKTACALQYASEELKRDREIVLEAVQQDGHALQYASAELRRDREIVLEAVRQKGDALKHLSEELKKDPFIVVEAMKENFRAFRFVGEIGVNLADIKQTIATFTKEALLTKLEGIQKANNNEFLGQLLNEIPRDYESDDERLFQNQDLNRTQPNNTIYTPYYFAWLYYYIYRTNLP